LLLMPLAPPALTAQAPSAAPTLEALQLSMEAIPKALVEGKPGATRNLVAQARITWEAAKPTLSKRMPEPDLIAIDRQLKAMKAMKPREQAVGALGISSILSRLQPRSHPQDLLALGRTTLMAWCVADDGHVERIPPVAEAFQPILAQDKGKHPEAAKQIQAALQRLKEAQQLRHASAAKKALKELLTQLNTLGQP
jgi:hypothetical protein